MGSLLFMWSLEPLGIPPAATLVFYEKQSVLVGRATTKPTARRSLVQPPSIRPRVDLNTATREVVTESGAP